jgi:heat-inducible transcriptional repressor
MRGLPARGIRGYIEPLGIMLAEKDRRILKTIVELYVSDGTAVSSRAVKHAGGYSMSTATIRNRMASLERAGYVHKPHTSAGRVPTDEGYRFYVNDLRKNQTEWEELSKRCRKELRNDPHDLNVIMLHASRFLGDASKNFAVVYGSVVQESRVSQLQLVKLEGSRILIVVNLVPEYEHTTVLRLAKEFSTEAIKSAENLINRVVGGKTLHEAKEELESVVRDNVTGEGIIAGEIVINRETVFSEPPAIELYFEERGHLLEQPELSDPTILQLILKLLHNKVYLTSILSNRLYDGTQVTIGAENEDLELKPFSLVTAGYRMGVAKGILGIIGPTRMRYDLALSLVGSVSRELRAIGEEYF